VFSFRAEDHAVMSAGHFFAFVDGVFAIITTLLVLDLRLPEHVPHGELAHALRELLPSFGAYAIGFLQTYAGWATLHRLSQRIRGIDQWMLIIFGLNLAVVALVPFSTAVLARSFGDPDDLRIAMLLVTAVGAATTAFFLLGTDHAFRRGFECQGTTPEQIAFGRRLGAASLAGWIVAVPLSWFAPWLALPMVIWGYGVALLPNRVDEFPVVAGAG